MQRKMLIVFTHSQGVVICLLFFYLTCILDYLNY